MNLLSKKRKKIKETLPNIPSEQLFCISNTNPAVGEFKEFMLNLFKAIPQKKCFT